jgi:hypothetical protein
MKKPDLNGASLNDPTGVCDTSPFSVLLTPLKTASRAVLRDDGQARNFQTFREPSSGSRTLQCTTCWSLKTMRIF